MFRSRSAKGAALLALSVSLPLGSCVADSVSLRISCKLSPENDCSYSTGGRCYLDGALNLASSRERYYGTFLVTNGLKMRARDVPPQSEPNGLTVKHFEIELTDSAGRKPALPGGLPNPYTVSANGDVPPDDEGLVGAELLPQTYVRALRALNATRRMGSIRLAIIARAKTWGDVEVESAPWLWTIQLTTVSERQESAADGEQQCLVYEDEVCTLGQDGWTYACNPAYVVDDM